VCGVNIGFFDVAGGGHKFFCESYGFEDLYTGFKGAVL